MLSKTQILIAGCLVTAIFAIAVVVDCNCLDAFESGETVQAATGSLCAISSATPMANEYLGLMPEKTKPVKLKDAKSFGKVKYDVAARLVVIEGVVKTRDTRGEPVELFAATNKSERLYECAIACDVNPIDLHKALLAIGMVPSGYLAERDEVVDIPGDKASLRVEWVDKKGVCRTVRAEDMFTDTRFDLRWDRWGWVFVGSFADIINPKTQKTQHIYRPDAEQSLVVNYHSPNSVFDNPRALGAFDHIYLPNLDCIPVVGTKLRLIFKPVAEAEIINGLIADATSRAGKIKGYIFNLGAKGEIIPADIAAMLEYYETRVKWLSEKVLPKAREIDAQKDKVRAMLNKIKALDAERQSEKDAAKIGAIKQKREIMLAEKDQAEKFMNLLYHQMWTNVADGELAEGTKLKVSKNAMEMLKKMEAHYRDRENIVRYNYLMSKAEFEIVQINNALGGMSLPEKARARRTLIELTTERDVFMRSIEREQAFAHAKEMETFVEMARKDLDDIKDQPDALPDYQEDYDRKLAELKQRQRIVLLAETRIKAINLRGEIQLAEYDGKTPDAKTVALVEKVRREEECLSNKIAIYALRQEQKEVKRQLDMAEIRPDDDERIDALTEKLDAIKAKIAALEKELEK